MRRLVLVRHGETIWHAENRYAGRSDIELTPAGEVQAQQLAAWAIHAGLNAVWSSPLLRARRTAEAAAEAAVLPLQMDERLIEIDFGRGEGKTATEMKALFPTERVAFERDPVLHHLPDGEDPIEASARGMAALEDIAAALPERGRALVVTHSTLLRLLLCRALGLSLSRYRNVFPRLSNVTGTELGFRNGQVSLLNFNTPLLSWETESSSHA